MRRFILLALLLALCAPTFGQFHQDPNTGDGSGGTGCYTCTRDDDTARVRCTSHFMYRSYYQYPFFVFGGYTSCKAYNSASGPNACVMNGRCYYDPTFELRTPEIITTLSQLIGLDATSALLDGAAIRTLGMTPTEREAETARLLTDRLTLESKARGIEDGYLVIPAASDAPAN